MREFQIGSYQTFTDWGALIQSGWTLDAANPKTNYVDIPDGDGQLDLTGVLTGEVSFENRNFQATLLFPPKDSNDRVTWNALREKISNAINGQRLKLVLPDDSTHYLMGRFLIGNSLASVAYDDFGPYATLAISAVCEPWRYLTNPKIVTVTPTTSSKVTLTNAGRRKVTPTITTNADITVSDGVTTVAVSANSTVILADLAFATGSVIWTITGDATVSITYQEADL